MFIDDQGEPVYYYSGIVCNLLQAIVGTGTSLAIWQSKPTDDKWFALAIAIGIAGEGFSGMGDYLCDIVWSYACLQDVTWVNEKIDPLFASFTFLF